MSESTTITPTQMENLKEWLPSVIARTENLLEELDNIATFEDVVERIEDIIMIAMRAYSEDEVEEEDDS